MDFRKKLPVLLYDAAQTRELDRLAIEQYGMPGIQLMGNAGESSFRIIEQTWPQDKNMYVFCGKGNNAGDGYVIARLAQQAGRTCRVFQIGALSSLSGDAETCAQDALQAGVVVEEINHPEQLDKIELDDQSVVVDALLGTGLRGKVGGLFGQVIERINNSGGQVFSVDIPSGLSADTGAAQAAVVKATLTNTFIGLKRGLLTGAGPVVAGRVFFDGLGVPEEVYQQLESRVKRIDDQDLAAALPVRARDGHKGKYGHVLIVGGNRGMMGAVAIAGEAALRSGAGLVSIATRPEGVVALTSRRPELMVHGVESGQQLAPLLDKASVIVLGPGLGQDEWAQFLFNQVIEVKRKPLVIDADGLNLLAHGENIMGRWRPDKRSPQGQPPTQLNQSVGVNSISNNWQWVLTPHPGEAARLLDCSVSDIAADRFLAVRQIAQAYNGIALLKGAGSLICNGGEINLASVGNPGMASGGMGDLLSGIVGGLIGQGMTTFDGARFGAVIHGAAADLASQVQGERGLIASDLFPHLRRLVNPLSP